MAEHLTKYFGKIDFDRLEEWYETEIDLNGKIVEVSITISTDTKSINKESIQAVDSYVENLQSNERIIRTVILNDFEEKGETNTYIDNQIEKQNKEDIADLIENSDKKLNQREKLLSVLNLIRIVFYPEKQDNMFAVFDYTIHKELTDDLLAVKLYKDYSVTIDIES